MGATEVHSPHTTIETAITTTTSASNSTSDVPTDSIRLQYPKSSRLLLGTTTNLQQPGFLKALETHHPLELSFECLDLTPPPTLLSRISPRLNADRIRNIRPFAVFFYRHPVLDAEWELIGRTETVFYDDYHRFVTKLKVFCASSEDRGKELRVEVYDRRSKSERIEDQCFIGAAQCTLEDIISEPLLKREMMLDSSRVTNPGRLILSADAIRPPESPRQLVLHVDMASITKASHRVFYVLSRQLQSGDYTAVYRSEVLERDENKFRKLVREVTAVTGGVDDKLLRLELFQYGARKNGAHVRLGFMQTSVDKLCKTERHGRLLWWPSVTCDGDNLVEVGRIVVLACSVTSRKLMFRLRVTQ